MQVRTVITIILEPWEAAFLTTMGFTPVEIGQLGSGVSSIDSTSVSLMELMLRSENAQAFREQYEAAAAASEVV